MFKLKGDVRGQPPTSAEATATELHMEDLKRRFYPQPARAAKVEGHASANCSVLDDGQLDNCWVTNEAPADAGFGEATLQILNLVKLTSPLPDEREEIFNVAWKLPAPAEQVFVNCLIAARKSTTSDCRTDTNRTIPAPTKPSWAS